jgi:hypothetical protein
VSFTAYATAVAGSILTAAFWNQQVRDNGNVLKTSIADDGTLASTGGILTTPELKAYKETKTGPSISSGTLTLDYSTGNNFGGVTLNQNITTYSVTNPPASGKAGFYTVVFIGDGTQRTITWPGSHRFPGGVAPTPTATNSKLDVYSFQTYDGGGNWLCVGIAQNL